MLHFIMQNTVNICTEKLFSVIGKVSDVYTIVVNYLTAFKFFYLAIFPVADIIIFQPPGWGLTQ